MKLETVVELFRETNGEHPSFSKIILHWIPGPKYWPKIFRYKGVNGGQNQPQKPYLTGKIALHYSEIKICFHYSEKKLFPLL